MNQDYFNRYNLLNSKIEEDVAENSPLWTLELFLINKDHKHIYDLMQFIDQCRTSEPGLFHQRPPADFSGNGDDYMSPDQLIAFVSTFHIENRTQAISNIWKYLYKHLFTYNNLKPGKIDFSRIQQISAVLFVGVLAGHKYLKPLLSIAHMISCFSKPDQTSGKLKAWTMFKVADMKWTEKICTFIISKRSKFKTWAGIFKEYFPREEHPISSSF